MRSPMPRTPYTKPVSPLSAAKEAASSLAPADAWAGWRPKGWAGEWGIADVLLAAEKAKAKARREETLLKCELEAVANEKLLRDCYNTPAWVPRLVAHVAGIEAWHCDPFANPTASGMLATCAVKLDGSSADKDGLAQTEDGAPLNWRGDTFANGPHSDPAPWVDLCRAHGQSNVTAALVQRTGTRWYTTRGLPCDLEIDLGRLAYEAPPGLPIRHAPPNGSAVLLWVPHLRADILAGRFRPYLLEVDVGKRKPQLVVVRPGFAGPADVRKFEG